MTSADRSVRVAWAGDAPAIAALQAESVAELPIEYDAEQAATAWAAALEKPGDARNRVLVALDRDRVVGFAVTTPAHDPDTNPIDDGEMSDLTVTEPARHGGHGSRLLQAAMDTLRADRFTRAVTWVGTTDDVLRQFLTEAGWAPDGAHREADLGGGTVKQVRLHTGLA